MRSLRERLDWLMSVTSQKSASIPPQIHPQPEMYADSKVPSRGYGLTHAALDFVTPEIRSFSSYLQHECPVSWGQFDAACGVAAPKMVDLPFGPQTDYLVDHKALL